MVNEGKQKFHDARKFQRNANVYHVIWYVTCGYVREELFSWHKKYNMDDKRKKQQTFSSFSQI